MFQKVLFACIISTALLFSQEKKPQVAVLDIEDPVLKKSESIALTERLIHYLEQTEQYTLLDRGMTATILQEQGFQQSGCTSGECAVEVGQLLGVQKMVSCKIGAVGKYYTISIRMIDVTTGKIDKSVAHDVVGTVEDVLTSGLKQAVNQLTTPQSKNPKESKQTKTEPVVQKESKPQPVALSPEEQFAKKKKAKVVLFGGVSLVSAGTSGFFWIDKLKTHKNYLASTKQDEMNTLIDHETQSTIIASAATGVTALFIPLTIISIKKKYNASTVKVSFAPMVGSQVAGVMVRGEF